MKILIVDDDPVSRTILRKIVASQPEHQVTDAENGATGWALLDDPNRYFDLVFLDLTMEAPDGFELAREDLRLRGPGEVLGERQSGMPLLRYADLEKDQPLAQLAREAAETLLERDPRAATRHVERWLASRHDYARA